MAKKVEKQVISWLTALSAACVVVLLSVALNSCSKSDAYIISKVVQLSGNGMACSGEQVKAPSGENYILTAGHCKPLSENGSIMARTEDGKELSRRVIAEDPNSDLLLLEGLPGVQGLDVAGRSYTGEIVRTFTHGLRFKTYKTEGKIIDEKQIAIPVGEVCPAEMPKFKMVEGWFGVPVCALIVDEAATTALIVPGSSGGAVVDSRGDIVGVVSAGDGVFGYLVKLQDIQKFIKNY